MSLAAAVSEIPARPGQNPLAQPQPPVGHLVGGGGPLQERHPEPNDRGDERGSDFAEAREDFPVCVPVGTHAPHAVGVALAFKLRREKRVAVCIFGDGATSKGDVAEALNIAGVWRLPLVFVINNNRWAISVPVAQQTAAETLAQKAIAAGIEGEQVDGNDVIAVREAVARAVAKARSGGGPHLIEALTYRLGDHTTADDAARYRPPEDVQRRWKEEPIARLRTYLVNQKHWDKAREEALTHESQQAIDAAVERVLTFGGEVLTSPMEVPGGSWIVHAKDPQGALFALVGQRA